MSNTIDIKEATPDQLFDMWISYLREEGTDRYKNSERTRHIFELIEMFKYSGMTYEECKMYYNKVLDALCHDEGKKGKGKYKGWKETVETDFNACLASTYIEKLPKNDVDEAISRTFNNLKKSMDFNEDIEQWVNEKFGTDFTESLIEDAHIFDSLLNIKYLEEMFS